MAAHIQGIEWDAAGDLPVGYQVDPTATFSAYIHVPFCDVRCGYCDFNTYVSDFGPGADRQSYARSVLEEISFSVPILDRVGMEKRPVSSIFFGGGTPSLLRPEDIGSMVEAIKLAHGTTEDVEVTLEANPDTVNRETLKGYAAAGVNRLSIGMQSAVPHVLSTLDRTHSPASVGLAVAAAREVGLQVSLDLIYGTPGESLEDWRDSLFAAVALEPDHVSAYSLIVEQGTKMGQQLRRGEIAEPDPDLEADKYELADALLGQAGYHWYEISNFAKGEHAESVHNQAYWQGGNWWGYGPGAHSQLGNARWWNVAHPLAYAGRVQQGVSPAGAGELLGSEQLNLEKVLLSIRTARGLAVEDASIKASVDTVKTLLSEGLFDPVAYEAGRLIPTLKGRLLADHLVRTLLDW